MTKTKLGRQNWDYGRCLMLCQRGSGEKAEYDEIALVC
jgi:hypothetical protein